MKSLRWLSWPPILVLGCGTPAAKYVDPACEREMGLLDADRIAETEACKTPKCVDEVQKRHDEKVDAACGGAQ